MNKKLRDEVKAVMTKWKRLINYLKEEGKNSPIKRSKIKQRA